MWTQKTLAIKAYFNLKNASVFKNSMESYNVKMKKNYYMLLAIRFILN